MPLIKLKPAENEYLRLYILLAATPLTSIGREGLENSSKQSQDLNDNKITITVRRRSSPIIYRSQKKPNYFM